MNNITSFFKSIPLFAWILAAFSVFIVGLLFMGGLLIGSYNGAASLRNTYEMKVKSNQAEFDGMWKKLSHAAEIPNEKKNAFKEIYESYAVSRTSKSQNQMMTWIKESVPNVDLSTYDHLMNIVTGSRDSWTMKQNELVSIAEQYNNKLAVFPGNFLLPVMGFQKIEPKIITSERTEESFQTGKDDNVSLFKK
jgi:hypothetical protein